MARLPLVLALATCALTTIPAVAHAAPRRALQPLADVAPLAPVSVVADRVVTAAPAVKRAATAQAAAATTGTAEKLMAADGQTVDVVVSSTYAAAPPAAQSYVDFLDGLAHGTELSKLTLSIVTPAEIAGACGAQQGDGVLACYIPASATMVVPGEQTEADATTSYLVAHEYGHHIAANRDNPPFTAVDYGPKYWASTENVCTRVLAGKLAPGNEAEYYQYNPGEAWAETYAWLKYPQTSWRYTGLLKPDAAAYAAARKDVETPWTASTVKTFTGTMGSSSTQREFSFTLTLDGAISFQLKGPKNSDFDLRVVASGKAQGTTDARGSSDRLTFATACVTTPEKVRVQVRRRAGAGAFSVKTTYAG
jgi:hypothetical protein